MRDSAVGVDGLVADHGLDRGEASCAGEPDVQHRVGASRLRARAAVAAAASTGPTPQTSGLGALDEVELPRGRGNDENHGGTVSA